MSNRTEEKLKKKKRNIKSISKNLCNIKHKYKSTLNFENKSKTSHVLKTDWCEETQTIKDIHHLTNSCAKIFSLRNAAIRYDKM